MKNIKKRKRIGKVRPELTFNGIIIKGYAQKLVLEKRLKKVMEQLMWIAGAGVCFR